MTTLRLLVMAPLPIEAWALGPGKSPRVRTVSFRVERTGMGLVKAAEAAARLSAGAARLPGTHPGFSAAVLTGLGGDLSGRHEPGHIVVADRIIDSHGEEVARLPAAALAGEIGRLGLTVRTGTVVSADHIVTGAERAELARSGAEVVDMESSAIARARWGVPLAVVRAISDAPGHELFSPAGAMGVWKGLRSLRATRPALAAWAAASGPKEVLLAEPRSFCAGVRRAIETVERAIHRYGPPVYVRRQIVHNAHVVAHLEESGAIFVDELDEVPDGARVVFSAHGVGTAVREEATRRGMPTIDATCPLVTKVHNEARRFAAAGRQVVLVGHAHHDEVEGTLGVVPGIRLVSTAEDVECLDVDRALPAAFVTQTTLATDDVADVIGALARRFPDLARPAASDICYASQNRQDAVRKIAPECDLVLVVGSANSSNSNRLVEVARRCGARAHLVDSAADLRLSWLAGTRRVGVTAGASAPEQLVSEVMEWLAGTGPISVEERSTGNEHVVFQLPPEVR
ncbi:MAG TPA: 4-hydroxy-3-methylbut-2-enyl diphosphate reductase [Acidimicrobiales bacterium]|nr:4-hydroxy-3-methylbut-2-enyl diphosphate reductase [Acidimicrobiales bacterium]